MDRAIIYVDGQGSELLREPVGSQIPERQTSVVIQGTEDATIWTITSVIRFDEVVVCICSYPRSSSNQPYFERLNDTYGMGNWHG